MFVRQHTLNWWANRLWQDAITCGKVWFVWWPDVIKGKRAIISHAQQTSGKMMECWRCETECKLTPEHPPCRPSSSRLWPCSLPPPLARQAESNLAKASRAHLLILSLAFLISFFLRTPWQYHIPLASFPSHPFPLLSSPSIIWVYFEYASGLPSSRLQRIRDKKQLHLCQV